MPVATTIGLPQVLIRLLLGGCLLAAVMPERDESVPAAILLVAVLAADRRSDGDPTTVTFLSTRAWCW